MTHHKEKIEERPPVVAVMGHVDHGKSTLLDYIRKTNVVDGEAGGITQRISAYEVKHKDEKGKEHTITFLDTPGHEAFSGMRERGALVADIAILIVSAEDGVKAQTKEALETILRNKVPYVVAINKIDKPGANVEKVKSELVENGVYLEGWGGQISFAEISAKSGVGIDSLLDTILLTAELAEFKGDRAKLATGYVIESTLDSKRGNSATLIVKDGTVKNGEFIVAGEAMTTTRIIEDFTGKMIKSASFSSPIRIVGFDKAPKAGDAFHVFATKKEAEVCVKDTCAVKVKSDTPFSVGENTKVIPLIIKAESIGTAEAVEKEIRKISVEGAQFKILSLSSGTIGEADVKLAGSDSESIIVGFSVKTDNSARDIADQMKVQIATFDIIYKLTDFLKEEIDRRRFRKEVAESLGKLKVFRTFSQTKERQVIGGKVTEGQFENNIQVVILRRDFEIGKGKIVGLQKVKTPVTHVEEGAECGVLVETKIEIATGDVLEAFKMVIK